MAKPRDFPHNLRHFVKVLNGFDHRYDDGQVFRDFVDYMTVCLLFHGDPKTVEYLRGRYGDDYPRFQHMYHAMLLTMDDMLKERPWCDPLGHLYQAISSQGHKQGMGQFFTPEELCDLMALSTIPADTRGSTINDPASGSGRTLLAVQAMAPGNTLYAQDLDPVCSKMAAINMALHGARGYVVCGDTIRLTFNFGYRVNPWQTMMNGMPHLLRLHPGEATPPMYDRPGASELPEPANDNIPAPVYEIGKQLALF